jgi:dihydroflavonol-4-reductase
VIHRKGSDLARVADIEGERRVGDLDDAKALTHALHGCDAVINCAGYYPTVPRPWRDEVERARAQMQRFYSACADVDLPKIVYVGGSIALRRLDDGSPGREDIDYPEAPPGRNAYVQVKWAMDRMALDEAARALPVVVGIPTMTFGEHDYGPTTGQLVVGVANGTLPGYIDGKRNVVYAGDAGRGLVRCVEVGRPGERYLLAGHNATTADLVRIVAELAQVTPPRAIPLPIARVVAAVGSARYRLFGGDPPRLTSSTLAVLAGGQFIDGSKAERDLDYAPTVSIRGALERALAFFREVGYVNAP